VSALLHPTNSHPAWYFIARLRRRQNELCAVICCGPRKSLDDNPLKNTGLTGIYSDILVLTGFSAVLVGLSVAFFKRQI
jgi:hypothetical protein